MFMQIYSFINITKEIELEQKFILSTKYSTVVRESERKFEHIANINFLKTNP